MEVIKRYSPEIETWKHENFEKFLGQISTDLYYEIGLSQPTILDDYFYYKVKVNYTTTNDLNGIVFYGSTSSTFQLKYERQAPTATFFFELLEESTYEFARIFHEKTQQTNLMHKKIGKPRLEDLSGIIQESIDKWDEAKRLFKESGRSRDILKFKNLPKIPTAKRYIGNTSTTEQKISFKLFNNLQLNSKEREIFKNLSKFYNELDRKLEKLDYSKFSAIDIKDFRDYITYVFNSKTLIPNGLSVNQLYRLVVNKDVSYKNESLTASHFLTYPKLELVKDKKLFNRASTSNSTVFYVTEDIDTALRERHPKAGELVTVGVWKPKIEKEFISYPIVHSNEAISVNKEILSANQSINQLIGKHDPLLIEFINYYLRLLSREFSKQTNCNLEYLLSAIFSEAIFEDHGPNPDFNFDCIIYPSVRNSYQTRNIAFKHSVADADFKLIKVIEFKIETPLYDQVCTIPGNPEAVNQAKISGYRVTENITESGDIIW